MNQKKTLFILIIILLLLNIIFSERLTFSKTGEIENIKYSKNKIEIKIKNDSNHYILFTNKIINLKKGQRISIIGKESTYRNEEQIIVNKIRKIN